MSNDLDATVFPDVTWKPGELGASLDAIYRWVEGEAVRAEKWYLREKVAKARASRGLRMLAVLLTTVGAIVPLVAAFWDKLHPEWGYVALALAAGALALDRFFGFSSAWMRYLTAQLAIHDRLTALRFEWTTWLASLGGQEPSAAETAKQLGVLVAAATAIHGEVKAETLAWVAEFQSNIAELRKLAASGKGGEGERAS